MILELNAFGPQPRKVDQIVETLQSGGLVAYPTDTVYGIGCDIFNRSAVEKLHALVAEMKDADHSPLAFICRDLSNISEYAQMSDSAHKTLRKMLPGPYTFILEATKVVPKVMLKKRKTVGVRVPDSAIPLAIVERLGNAIATTSATLRTGELVADPWTLEDVYGHAIDLVVDGGYLQPEPSTVIDLTDEYPTVVRQGKGALGDLDVEYVELL